MTERTKQAVEKIADYLVFLAHQNDYETIMQTAQHDNRFREMVQDMTIGEIAGKSRLNKNRHIFKEVRK